MWDAHPLPSMFLLRRQHDKHNNRRHIFSVIKNIHTHTYTYALIYKYRYTDIDARRTPFNVNVFCVLMTP